MAGVGVEAQGLGVTSEQAKGHAFTGGDSVEQGLHKSVSAPPPPGDGGDRLEAAAAGDGGGRGDDGGDGDGGGGGVNGVGVGLGTSSSRGNGEGATDEVSRKLSAVSEALALLEDAAILPSLYRLLESVQVEVDLRSEARAKTIAAGRIERVSV